MVVISHHRWVFRVILCTSGILMLPLTTDQQGLARPVMCHRHHLTTGIRTTITITQPLPLPAQSVTTFQLVWTSLIESWLNFLILFRQRATRRSVKFITNGQCQSTNRFSRQRFSILWFNFADIFWAIVFIIIFIYCFIFKRNSIVFSCFHNSIHKRSPVDECSILVPAQQCHWESLFNQF